MRTPSFFDDVAPIEVTDPLAALLGAAEGGRIEYHYLDAVKLAGHSCPTVAGAWLMTRTALARLYPDGSPQRGGLRVELREAASRYPVTLYTIANACDSQIAPVSSWLPMAFTTRTDLCFDSADSMHCRMIFMPTSIILA